MGLGSEIQKNLIPEPGVKKAPDPGSATLIPTADIEKPGEELTVIEDPGMAEQEV
jgi:hypothetical protein